MLFYVGCTAGAELAADVFGSDDALTAFATPVRFASRAEMLRGMLRAVAPPRGSVVTRAALGAMGDFAGLVSSYFVGHSAGVPLGFERRQRADDQTASIAVR